MLKLNAKTPELNDHAPENDTQNFRIFDKNGYTSAPIPKTINERPVVVYVMVSLFNSLFSRYESVKYMMEQTDLFFGGKEKIAPVFYLNSTELQEITRESMFGTAGNKKSNPVKNAEKKWLDKFQKSEKNLKDENIFFWHETLSWPNLLRLPVFQAIHRFVQAIFLPETTTLHNAFPAVSTEIIAQLSQEMHQPQLADSITDAINVFIAHNEKRFNANNDQKAGDYLTSLRHYLSQEFAVFLVLAHLDTLQKVREAFGIQLAISIATEKPIQPVLSYPISAAKDGLAEKTLSAFLAIQGIYKSYSAQLGLPSIETGLILVDSYLPMQYRSETKKINSFLSFSNGGGAPETESSLCSNVKLPQVQASGTDRSVSRTLSTASASTFYRPTPSDKITKSIFNQFMDIHNPGGAQSVKMAYQNGAICNIVNLGRKLEANNQKKKNAQAVFAIIEKTVASVLESDEIIMMETVFYYEDICYQLSVSSATPAVVMQPK